MPGVLIGYGRVSSVDQKLEIQTEQLKAAGCEKIFAEKMSGKAADNRAELQKCLAYVREGDVLVVTRLDRLGRSLPDLLDIVLGLREKGVEFRALQQCIDTSTSEGRMMLGIMGTFAEYEREIRAERQREGIEKAKQKGVYKKIAERKRNIRKKQVDHFYHVKGVRDLKLIAAACNVSERTVQRYLEGHLAPEPEIFVQARENKKLAEPAPDIAALKKEADKIERSEPQVETGDNPAPAFDAPIVQPEKRKKLSLWG